MRERKKQSKWPKDAIHIPVPIYGGSIFIFTNVEDYEQANAHLGIEANTKDCVGQFTYVNSDDTGRLYLVLIDNHFETVHHEISHVALTICENAGFSAEDGNQEPFCYLAADLFSECLRKLKLRNFTLM